ncbi:hypothetical protein AMJ80_04205 [bacterium SM23_31]|nr:MAG: hypothetical protein AMJ80_04205 [bacterium SM23_31]
MNAQIANVNDETYLLLALKKEKARFEEIRNRWELRQLEYKDGFTSKEEYNRTQQEYEIALVNYQQAMLRVIFDQPYIVVEEAIKYQAESGDKKHVRLKLTNTTGGVLDYQKLLESEGEIFTEDLMPDRINNVFVSLINIEDNTIISKPYERKIPSIEFGKSVRIDFELLRDVESVRISMVYANNTSTKDVYLEKDATANTVEIVSAQFSQEAELGSNTAYNMQLERFSSEDNIYYLEVVNLPRQITHTLVEQGSSARLSSIKFTKGITKKNLTLTLYMPDRDDEEIVIDEPLNFYIMAVSKDKRESLGSLKDQELSPEEILNQSDGMEKLELIPRGVGKMEVVLNTLYYPVKAGESISVKAVIKNTGTRRLDNVAIRTEYPLNWNVLVQPELIRTLDVGKEDAVELLIQTAEDAGVGDMTVKVKADAIADNRSVESDDKEIRVHVEAGANIFGTLILIFLFLVITIGMVIFGIKLSRK